MSFRALLVLLSLVPPLVVGCTSEAELSAEPSAEPSAQVELADRGETTIVHSRGPQWVEGQAWAVTPGPGVVIGVLEGAPEYQLVEVVGAARRSDGSLVVADRGSRTVRLYDSRGTFLQTFGGPGSGPGEFTGPASLQVTAGDTVVVWDDALLRVTRFDADGELAVVRTVDWGLVASGMGLEASGMGLEAGGKAAVAASKGKGAAPTLYPGPMEPLPGGGFLVRLVEKASPAPGGEAYRPQSGAVRLTRDLSVADTLMMFGDTEQVMAEAPWGPFPVTPPLAKETRITHGGDPPAVCIGDQATAEIVCFEPEDGSGFGGSRRRRVLRWDLEPLPFDRAELGAWRERMVQTYEEKLSRSQVLEMLAQAPIPQHRPPHGRILLDRGGNLWAERGPSAKGPDGWVD